MNMQIAYRHFNDGQIIEILYDLDIRYLSQSGNFARPAYIAPEELIANMVRSQNARIRAALIALFMVKPHFAEHILKAASELNLLERKQLELFYSAARLLQMKYREQLNALLPFSQVLPDLFAGDGFARGECANVQDEIESGLLELGRLHREITGLLLNWTGTYNQAAIHLIKQLENKQRWQCKGY